MDLTYSNWYLLGLLIIPIVLLLTCFIYCCCCTGPVKEQFQYFLEFVPEGYTAKKYKTHTSDGYIISLYNLRSDTNYDPNRVPIYIQHGLGATSLCWVMPGENKGLGPILADRGYDVWLGNSRGTSHSMEHEVLSPKDPAFWEFTF